MIKERSAREKSKSIRLNDWELLAIEKALEDFLQAGKAQYTSVQALLEKIRNN